MNHFKVVIFLLAIVISNAFFQIRVEFIGMFLCAFLLVYTRYEVYFHNRYVSEVRAKVSKLRSAERHAVRMLNKKFTGL